MKIEQPPGDRAAPRRALCTECSTPIELDDSRDPRCEECRPTHRRDLHRAAMRGSARARGYDSRWDKLSRRARRVQPFCTDCGTTSDLSTDHSTAAWKAKAAGKPITLDLVDVVCLACNSRRGAARGIDATDDLRNRQRELFSRIETDETMSSDDDDGTE